MVAGINCLVVMLFKVLLTVNISFFLQSHMVVGFASTLINNKESLRYGRKHTVG